MRHLATIALRNATGPLSLRPDLELLLRQVYWVIPILTFSTLMFHVSLFCFAHVLLYDRFNASSLPFVGIKTPDLGASTFSRVRISRASFRTGEIFMEKVPRLISSRQLESLRVDLRLFGRSCIIARLVLTEHREVKSARRETIRVRGEHPSRHLWRPGPRIFHASRCLSRAAPFAPSAEFHRCAGGFCC